MSETLVDWWYDRVPPWMEGIATGPVGGTAVSFEVTLDDIGGASRARPPKASIPFSSTSGSDEMQYVGPREYFQVTHLPADYYERCQRCGTSITFKEHGPRNYPMKRPWCDTCEESIENERSRAHKERMVKVVENRERERAHRQRERLARSVDSIQYLTCDTCLAEWTRPKQRGRPPLTCPSCKERT